jgi:hypothetical protein
MPPDVRAWKPELLLLSGGGSHAAGCSGLGARTAASQRRRLPCRRMFGRGSPNCYFSGILLGPTRHSHLIIAHQQYDKEAKNGYPEGRGTL